MFGNGLCHSVKHALKIVELAGLLYLNDNDVALTVAGLYVHTVVLVIVVLLIAFALKYLDDMHRLIEQNGDESLQHTKVGLVAKHALGGPIEANVLVVVFHLIRPFFLLQI